MVDEVLGTDIAAVHFSPDSSWLAVTHEDGVIGLWDAKRGDAIGTFDHGATIQQLTFSPNSQRLVTLTNEPDTLRIWDLRTARDKFAPLEIGSDLSAAAIGEDGFLVLLCRRQFASTLEYRRNEANFCSAS